jgi:NTP pyrophosphatase (non-canonical NTP hydrolase)
MNSTQYKIITEWQDQIFTKATPSSCAAHLLEESAELVQAINCGVDPKEEIADCFMLLFGVCNKLGLQHYEIIRLIDAKFEINQARKWGELNEKGYVKHID